MIYILEEGWTFATFSLCHHYCHTVKAQEKECRVPGYPPLQCRTNSIFPLCFLQIFAYMNETSSRKEKWDLQALRFLSINSIIDPWVFAILRPPVLRLMRSVLCCRTSLRAQDAPQTSCSTQSNASKQADLCGQSWGHVSLGSIWKILWNGSLEK
jgi:hypothetical protein